MDVSDRRLQAWLTMQSKIPAIFIFFVGIFAFAGFVSGLRLPLMRELSPMLIE